MFDVVLDENVYIRALESERTGNIEDLRAARVVSLVQEKHRWLLTHDVVAAYRHQFSRIRGKNSVTIRLMKSLTEVCASGDRSKFLDSAPIIPGKYDRHDEHVVAAAAARPGAYLVTLDTRLKQALELAEIPGQFGFRAIDVAEAKVLLD